MGISIRTEGTAGSIVWLLPDRLSNTINEFSKIHGDTAKTEVCRELTHLIDSFSHLVYGTLLSPKEIMHESLNSIYSFISLQAKINSARLDVYNGGR